MLNMSNKVKASPSCRILKPSEGKLAEHGGANLKFQHTEPRVRQVQGPGQLGLLRETNLSTDC